MHSISPYLFRCFNSNSNDGSGSGYAALDEVGQHDTLDLLKNYISSKMSNFEIIDETKQVFVFNGFDFNIEGRAIYGWMKAGTFGIKSEIIDVNTGTVDFTKAENNAEIINHFMYFFIPNGFNEGIALLHGYRGNGVKTLFHEGFKKYFKEKTNLIIQMNPLSYKKAFDQWVDGDAKEIRLIKFKGLNDPADQLSMFGHEEKELIIKSTKKSSTLGKFKDYLNPDSEQAKAVEILSPLCSQIKTVIDLGGKKRTFTVGISAEKSICEIEAPEELELVNGNPTLNGMASWCKEIAIEFSAAMYPGLEVTP